MAPWTLDKDPTPLEVIIRGPTRDTECEATTLEIQRQDSQSLALHEELRGREGCGNALLQQNLSSGQEGLVETDSHPEGPQGVDKTLDPWCSKGQRGVWNTVSLQLGYTPQLPRPCSQAMPSQQAGLCLDFSACLSHLIPFLPGVRWARGM